MSPRNEKLIKKIGLVWAGLLVLFLAGYFGMISPQKKTVLEFVRKLDEAEKNYKLAIESSDQKYRDNLITKTTELEAKLSAFAIDFEDSANLIFDVSQLASSNKANLVSIEGQRIDQNEQLLGCERISEGTIKLNLSSSFPQFAKFLNELERNNPVIFVDSFNITRNQEDTSCNDVEMYLKYLVIKEDKS